jgi:hypothetical protein
MTQVYHSGFYPDESSPGVVGTTVPSLTEARVQTIIDDLDIILGDDTLSKDEKARVLIPLDSELGITYSSVIVRLGAMALSTTALNNARTAWLNYRNALSPAWNDVNTNTTIVRATFRSTIDAYITQLVAAEDAIALKASQTADIATGLKNNGAQVLPAEIITSQGTSLNTTNVGTRSASNLNIPDVVATLPTTGNYTGRVVTLSTDGKLYRYFSGAWTAAVPTVDLSGTINFGQIGTGAVGLTNFATGLAPVESLGSLPTTGNFEGRMVLFGGKLYRYTSGAFTASVGAADVTGQLTSSQIASITAAQISTTLTAGQIPGVDASKIISGTFDTTRFADGAITAAKFAAGIEPIEILGTLPVSGNFTGRMVFLTTDGKLYRYASGAFTASVGAADVTGQLTSAQISSITAAQISTVLTATQIPGVDASKIISGTFDTARLADGAITAAKFATGLSPIETVATLPGVVINNKVVFLSTDGKLYRGFGGAWVATTAAADITGQVSNAQIASITAAKISDTLTATQIPGLDSAKIISGTLAPRALLMVLFPTLNWLQGLQVLKV